MFEEVIQLVGKEPGPTSMILVGIHGDEKCGVKAFEKILPALKIESGKIFIAYGNPRALRINRRFVESNLNRMFKDDNSLSKKDKISYEYNRARFLKKYLDESEALLDVHTSLTPDSRPFIICEKNSQEIVKYLPLDIIVSGFDQIEPGGTDYYMNKHGKIGICAECGYLNDPESVKIAEEIILAFISARGHIKNNMVYREKSYLQVFDLYKTKTDHFNLSKPFADFEEITAQQIIGIDGEKEVRAVVDSFILFARNKREIGSEAFLLGKKKESLT